MAEQTLTAWTINSLLIGLLILGLLSSYILLVNNEGEGEIFDDYPEIVAYNLNLTNIMGSENLITTANVNSNLSASYNPEIAVSGADQSQTAISTNLQDIVTITWTSIGLLGLLLFGNIYTGLISGLLIAIIGYVSVAYAIKAIRTGQT